MAGKSDDNDGVVITFENCQIIFSSSINEIVFYFARRFRERQMFVSSGTHMTLFVRRLMADTENAETEFLDGAYSFFNGLSITYKNCQYETG